MKRKILAAALVLGMCFTFAGCGGGGKDNGKTSDKEKAKEIILWQSQLMKQKKDATQ